MKGIRINKSRTVSDLPLNQRVLNGRMEGKGPINRDTGKNGGTLPSPSMLPMPIYRAFRSIGIPMAPVKEGILRKS